MPDAIQPAEDVGYVLCDDLIFTSRITGTAQALGMSERTVKREWQYARAWLYRELA